MTKDKIKEKVKKALEEMPDHKGPESIDKYAMHLYGYCGVPMVCEVKKPSSKEE